MVPQAFLVEQFKVILIYKKVWEKSSIEGIPC